MNSLPVENIMNRWKPMLVVGVCLTLVACSAELQIADSGEHGAVMVGESKDIVYTITNAGTHPAQGLAFAPLPRGWEDLGGSCGPLLQRKASCSHVVRFSPTEVGPSDAELVLTYSDKTGHRREVSRALHGVGTEPEAPSCYRGVKSYSGWEGSWDMHAWEGERTVLYAQEKFDDALACKATQNMDTCFALYQKLGQRTWPSNVDPYFPGKGTLAIVPTTCGAGCGGAGKAEMLDSYFVRNGGDPSDPYSLWIGFYEFGREGGEAFPFFRILTNVTDRMTAAFPEYIWETCLRDLGLSEDELARRGPFSPALYRERFLRGAYSYVQYQARPGNAEWHGVSPSQITAAVFYDLHRAFGEDFAQTFFAHAKQRQAAVAAPADAYQGACNLLQLAESADPTRRTEVRSLLQTQWRFPADCSDFEATCAELPSRACGIAQGVGYQSRTCVNGTWTDWSSCSVASCEVGYDIDGASCVAARDLGLDLNLYCAETFGATFHAVLEGATAYDWVCLSDTGERNGMDLNQACLRQHNLGQAAFRDFNDPYSWYCQAE